MTASGRNDQRTRLLARSALLAVLLGLSACGTMPAPADGPEAARAPGVYFHNDVVLFNAVGAGSRSR